MRLQREVEVEVVYEEGYEKRFTDYCLLILRRKRKARELENQYSGQNEKAQKTTMV